MLELSGKYNKEYTYDDLMQLEEGTLCELINGIIEMSPAPLIIHQIILKNLSKKIDDRIQESNKGLLLPAPVDLIIDEKNVVQPDLLFISLENIPKIRDKYIDFPPDIVIEIISPSSVVRDRYGKKELYQKMKIQEYWMLDIIHESIEILRLDNAGHYQLSSYGAKNEIVKSQILEKFEFCFDDVKPDAELFNKLK